MYTSELKFFAGLIAFVVGVFWLANLYGQYQCSNFQETTGSETKYLTLDVCYVNTKTGWQRWDEYKARATASEGLGQ